MLPIIRENVLPVINYFDYCPRSQAQLGNAVFGASLRWHGDYESPSDQYFAPLEVMPNGQHIRRQSVKQSFTRCIPNRSSRLYP